MNPLRRLSPDDRRALRDRMRVPTLAFAALLGLLAAIVLLGALVPSRAASLIEAGAAACMVLVMLLLSMEVRKEAPLMRFFSLLGFAWLGILFGMTVLDYVSR